MHLPYTSLHHAFHPPWCCLVVSFDNIERSVGVYMPLRAPTVAAEVCGEDGTQSSSNQNAVTQKIQVQTNTNNYKLCS